MPSNIAVTVTGPGTVRIAEATADFPEGAAIVAVERAGLCGTDAKIVSGALRVAYPRIIGHEIVGTVVGGIADARLVGARVLLNPTISCGTCAVCRRDRPNLCPTGYSLGIGADGGMRALVAVDQRQLHPLPATVSWDEATSLQVLGTCVHAQSLLDVTPGQVAVVVGLGVSGLLHLQLLRRRGATVIGITRSVGKRQLAEQLGATVAAHPDRASQVVAELTDGHLADVVVETAGSLPALAQAVDLTRRGGELLAFGIYAARAGRLPFTALHERQLVVRGARGAGPRDYEDAVALVAAGAVRTAPLLSSTWPLARAAEALAAMEDPQQLKVAFAPGSDN